MANLYDRVRYPNLVFHQTHPLATGAFAALFGRPFVPFASSRVLEIGCGEGVNLINMALGAPEAECVGVDLAERPIALARDAARRCGCANLRFDARDLIEVDASFGRFDYIIAHGVYSWVPAQVRAGLMRLAGERLSADGLALVSYNALPGSRRRQAIRDMLIYVTKGVEDPEAKLSLARSFLTEQVEAWSDTEADEFTMKSEARRILERAPEVLFHDELSEDYAPQLLSDVIAAAAQCGLSYLCDAQPNLSGEALFPSDPSAATRDRTGAGWARLEQLADFRSVRAFRYSIFCRGGADRRREAARLRDLWATGELTIVDPDPSTPEGAVFEAGPNVKIRTHDPKLAEFLIALSAAFPLGLPLEAASENPVLADHIFRLFVSRIAELATAPWPLAKVAGERPKVGALARLQAENGETLLATLRHRAIRIEDAPVRALIPLIDGTRTRAELALEIAGREAVSAADASARLDEILARFARAGLLAG